MTKHIDLKDFLEEIKDRIDPAIEELLKLNLNPEREEMILHQIRVGGKRLRPALAVASCFLFGGNWSDDIVYPAAGLEILHNYTLIVDDMIDRGHIRRGEPTTWKKYGYSLAHNAGMFYAASLLQSFQKTSKIKEVSSCLAQTLKIVIEGEIKDVLADAQLKEDVDYLKKQKTKEITLDNYYQIISEKTASLISASVRIGAIVSSAPKNLEEKISDYGFNLGMAFQISDDILDIFGDENEFGKEIGKDLMEGKRSNAVLLLALSEMENKKRDRCLQFLEDKNKTKKELKDIIEEVKSTNALSQAQLIGNEFVDKAKESLNSLPDNQWRTLLSDLSKKIITRNK